MTGPIESSRNNCAFIGALQTVQTIKGVVPILHSTAGCGLQQYLGSNRVSGCSGSGYAGGIAIPSTNVIERQVIFGGTSRLREQIKNTVKVVKGDLYVVLSDCATELVGDDIPAMAKEAQDQDFPVVFVNTPGFQGDIHLGYQQVFKGLLEQLSKIGKIPEEKVVPGLINILGIIPYQDVFWQGHLLELQSILDSVGLKANTLFGQGQGIDNWKNIPRAELNVVFSPWGIETARYLEAKFGTPYVDFHGLPVGADDTNRVLQVLAEKLDIDVRKVEEVQKREDKRLAYYLDRIADIYFEAGLQKEFAVVGESAAVLGLSLFLIKSFGLIPKTLIITDNPQDLFRLHLTEEINQLALNLKIEILYIEDRGKIKDSLQKSKPELILGSSLEQEAALELNVPLLQVSFPITDQVVLSKSYIGYSGAVALLEDLSSQVISWQSQLDTVS